MHPNGAKKNKLAQAIFSKDGPNRSKPAVTKSPSVTPKIYKVNNKKIQSKYRLQLKIGTTKSDQSTKHNSLPPSRWTSTPTQHSASPPSWMKRKTM